MLNYIHTLFSNLQLKDIKSDVIGYFSIVIVTVRGFSLQINNTLFNWENIQSVYCCKHAVTSLWLQ